MNDDLRSYLTGTGFVLCSFLLDCLKEPVWSLVSAVVGVYILGSLLLKLIREIWEDNDQNNTHKPA